MLTCVVIIPIYRPLNVYEKASLLSCCNLLKNYDICFVTNKNVDISIHLNIAKEVGVKNIFVEFFNKSYFKNIHGYNRLMLSKEFYTRFCKYDYMLISQLDAYIFKDNLEYWCNLGFDYIGAPLFPPSNGEIKIDKCFVGNGGLSLRKINKFIEVLNYKFSIKELFSIKRIESSYFIWRKKLVYFLMLFCLGRINSLFFILAIMYLKIGFIVALCYQPK
jgi:hypothetical protein